MPNDENKKLSAEELATKLEEKAKKLRESGLSPEQLEKIAGGGWCHSDGSCCGSSCCLVTNLGGCSKIACEESGSCCAACIESSPD